MKDRYTYKIEWSNDSNEYFAKCLEFPSLSAYGKTQEEALKEIKFVVHETLEWMKEENEPIPEPFSIKKFKGKLTLRVPPDMHRLLAMKSAEQGVSVNQYIISKL